MARFLFTATLALVALLGAVPEAGAQVPPLDEATDPIEDTVDQLEDTVDEVEGALDETVDETVGTVEQTAEGAGVGDGGASDAGGGLTGGSGAEGGSATGSLSEAVGASGADAGGSSGGGEPRTRDGGGTGRSQASGLGTDSGARRMARVLSETGRASLAPAAFVPLVVELTNDADGDGSYADAESAPQPRADIPFQLRLENAGPHELVILAIRDASPSPLGLSDHPACEDMVGERLAPGQSTVCRFTVERLAPNEGERLVAVVEVDAAETADPSTTGTITDTSVISTGGVGVLGDFVRRILATTGAWIAGLVAVAVGLAAVGVWMVRAGDRRREVGRAWTRSGTAAPIATARPGRYPRSPRRTGRSHHTTSVAGHVTVRREKPPTGAPRRSG